MRRSTASRSSSTRYRCACASATCWSAAARAIRAATSPRRSRCSRTPSHCAIATRCRARISISSTRCTCWASRRQPAEQLDWNRKALAAAEASSDPRARNWAGSLTHNIGWSYFDSGDPATALVYWQKALPIREAQGNVGNIRFAKWTIARGLRATGKLDDAEKIQLALVAETEKAGEPDGYVYEELAEIAIARGDKAAAAPWAVKAYALLKDDEDLKADKPERLARLADLAKPAATPK